MFEGEGTWPAEDVRRRIDTVLVPEGWRVVEERVLDVGLSDHEPVVVWAAR